MRHLGLDDLALFVDMARAGGVRALARAGGASRSHLSRRLTALEERVGVRLVERDELRFVLTGAGRVLLARVESVLADVRDAEQAAHAASGRIRGRLRVDSSPLLAEVALEAVVHDFVARHPEVTVHLHVAAERVDLRAQSVDVAFRTGPLNDEANLRQRLLGRSITAMLATPEYLARRGVPQNLAELARHDGIFVSPARDWALRDGRVALRERLRFNAYAPAKRAALAGLGIARFAAIYAERELASGQLQVVMPEQSTETSVFAVMPGSGRLGATVKALLELAAARITTETLVPAQLRARLVDAPPSGRGPAA